MNGRGWIAFLLAGIAIAPAPAAYLPTDLQISWRDDAGLNDVEFVSAVMGGPLGEHGALWRTQDGGETWSPCETGTAASLRSICRLTDQIGWIAGVVHRGPAELSQALLLMTRDGVAPVGSRCLRNHCLR